MSDPSIAQAIANLQVAVFREVLDLSEGHPLLPTLSMLDRAFAGENLRDGDREAVRAFVAAVNMTEAEREAAGLGWVYDPCTSILERIAWAVRAETACARVAGAEGDPWAAIAELGAWLENLVAVLDGAPFVEGAFS